MGPTERYDPITHTWTRLGDLGFHFAYGAVAVLNGEIWACGGRNLDGQCHILDTSTNNWIPAATMNMLRSVKLNSKSHPLL